MEKAMPFQCFTRASCAVQAGEEGRAKFQADVRRVLELDDDEDIQLSFGCKVPDTGAV